MKNSRPTQAEDVLAYLRAHGSITHREAEDELGVMRLASRVYELKRKGNSIKSELVQVKARNGRCAYVARYSLA